MDYTPGLFDCGYKDWGRFSTRANQLALFVVIWSPLQMAADLYQAYDGEPAFQFIRNVPVGDWDETKVLDAVIGDYVVMARRKDERWYLGAVNDEEERELELDLSFLEEGKDYEMVVYEDTEGADYERNPNALRIRQELVSRDSLLKLSMARGGGAAVEIYPKGADVSKPKGQAGGLRGGAKYTLRAKHSGRLLTEAADGKLVQAAEKAGLNQTWIIRRTGSGDWKIVGSDSLGIAGGSLEDGAALVVGGGELEAWRFEHISGSFFLVKNLKSGKCLDVAEVSYEEGAPVHQWEHAYSPNQVWAVERVE